MLFKAHTVAVVDTVGSFQAALLFALRAIGGIEGHALGQMNSDELCRVLMFASTCAAFTCGRTGADPPRQADVGAALSRLCSSWGQRKSYSERTSSWSAPRSVNEHSFVIAKFRSGYSRFGLRLSFASK